MFITKFITNEKLRYSQDVHIILLFIFVTNYFTTKR